MKLLLLLLLLPFSGVCQGYTIDQLAEGSEYPPAYEIHNGYDAGKNIAAHQYFETSDFRKGIIYFTSGRGYEVRMRYDIVNDVITYIDYRGLEIMCFAEQVSAFILANHTFVIDCKHFYERVQIGDNTYLIKHHKTVLPLQYVNGEMHDVISEQKDRYYLVVDGQLKYVKHPKL